MAFNEKYAKILDVVKDDIKIINQEIILNISTKEPLNSKLIDFLTSPSKRIRPLLAFLYMRANDVKPDIQQFSLQTAIELAHNASLIHDDIIDDSETRRTQKSINKEFGNKLAVISGDYILANALKKIGSLNSQELICLFAETLSCMCNGEITQNYCRYDIPTIEEYITKSKQKTGKLFKTALEGAAILNPEINRKQAAEFGETFGTAFQIRDDLINILTTKTDLHDGIYNAPVIYAGSIVDVESGIEKTYLLLNNYLDKAFELVSNLKDNIYKQAIIELLEILKNE